MSTFKFLLKQGLFIHLVVRETIKSGVQHHKQTLTESGKLVVKIIRTEKLNSTKAELRDRYPEFKWFLNPQFIVRYSVLTDHLVTSAVLTHRLGRLLLRAAVVTNNDKFFVIIIINY